MPQLGVYILTIGTPGSTTKERWDVEGFNKWLAAQGEKVGGNFTTRRDQFRRYTETNVIDWEWEEE